MKKIGEYFRAVRMAKNLSFEEVEQKTKIKKQFIKAIEKEQWNLLPEYPILFGFIKNLASFYDLDENRAVALFRRDYPPEKKPKTDPKPLPKREFTWNPKFTFAAGIVVAVIVVASYLVFQYSQFVSPPLLEIVEPTENQIVTEQWALVRGRTDPEATVVANSQPLLVNNQGVFEEEIGVAKETKEIIIIARSRSGKETTIRRTIQVNLP